jgi:hypothetical protein
MADAARRFGIEKANDGAKTLAGICDYIEAFFDKFLLGNDQGVAQAPDFKPG